MRHEKGLRTLYFSLRKLKGGAALELMIYLREMNFVSVLLRLLLAMLCGGILGMDRMMKHRPAGFRTYIIVCIGASLTMLLSQYIFKMTDTTWADLADSIGIKTDVSRFGAQVINGIGFLGAGTIILTGRKQVKGITTAAGLLAAACMGLAIGAGFYECAAVAFPLILMCMVLMPRLDIMVRDMSRYMDIYVEIDSLDNIGELLKVVKEQGTCIYEVEIEKKESGNQVNPAAVLSLRLKKEQTHTNMLALIAELECVYALEEI